MKSELKDSSSVYWKAESEHLFKSYERHITPLIAQEECKHFSIFALAPQPLLIQLGALLTDKISVETYQPRREPKGWSWQEPQTDFDFIVNKPVDFNGTSVLLLSLSDHVSNDRIKKVLGNNVSVWELTIDCPNNDFMKSKEQLSLYRDYLRKLMVDIKKNHGNTEPLHIFPVMPVSCAIELGRIRMPKADMPWIIYDQDFSTKEFVKSIEIRGDIHVR